jgi:serine/threonine protein kinase
MKEIIKNKMENNFNITELNYRAPEVLMNVKSNSLSVDIWSIGIIFGELVFKKKLFASSNEAEQLETIQNEMDGIDKGVFDKIFEEDSYHAYDLFERILEFNYFERINVFDAVQHPFFKNLYSEKDFCYYDQFDFTIEKNLNFNIFKELINLKIKLNYVRFIIF